MVPLVTKSDMLGKSGKGTPLPLWWSKTLRFRAQKENRFETRNISEIWKKCPLSPIAKPLSGRGIRRSCERASGTGPPAATSRRDRHSFPSFSSCYENRSLTNNIIICQFEIAPQNAAESQASLKSLAGIAIAHPFPLFFPAGFSMKLSLSKPHAKLNC